jgi:four helix bundle protein
MKDFRRLQVWGKAHELALRVYCETRAFPPEELYGLTAQARRAGASVPANLAEGCGRKTDRELGRFLQIGMGSATELEYHLLLARDLGYLTEESYGDLQARTVEVQRMLAALIRRVQKSSGTGRADFAERRKASERSRAEPGPVESTGIGVTRLAASR